MYELKKVGIVSSAQASSFIVTVLYAVFVILAAATGRLSLAAGNGIVTVLVGIIIASVVGMVLGALTAWLYNLVAAKWGGLHLEFHLIHEPEEHTMAREDVK